MLLARLYSDVLFKFHMNSDVWLDACLFKLHISIQQARRKGGGRINSSKKTKLFSESVGAASVLFSFSISLGH